jgi:hypothetical protein
VNHAQKEAEATYFVPAKSQTRCQKSNAILNATRMPLSNAKLETAKGDCVVAVGWEREGWLRISTVARADGEYSVLQTCTLHGDAKIVGYKGVLNASLAHHPRCRQLPERIEE